MGEQNLTELQLELCAHCNSNCKMCLREKMERDAGIMDTEFAIRIVEQAYNLGARILKPQWFGETLMAYSWKQVVMYAKTRGMRIVFTTNGMLANRENRSFILKYVDSVIFSIDSHRKDIYENIRRGLNFDTVINNLRDLYKEKKDCDCLTEIGVAVVKSEHNKYEIDDLKKFFKPISDKIIINKEIHFDKIDNRDIDVFCQHKVYKRLVVGWDGICYLCCHDWLGLHKIGDLRKQTIEEVWFGKERKDYLKSLGKLGICQQCNS